MRRHTVEVEVLGPWSLVPVHRPCRRVHTLLDRWSGGAGADSCYGLLGGALCCWLSGWCSTPEGSSTPVRTAPTTKMDPDTMNAVV